MQTTIRQSYSNIPRCYTFQICILEEKWLLDLDYFIPLLHSVELSAGCWHEDFRRLEREGDKHSGVGFLLLRDYL